MCQIALSVLDIDRALEWYTTVLGLMPSGRRAGGGPETARVQGLDESEFEVAWLVDQLDYFQVELFCFTRPAPRGRASARKANDVGYARIGIHVEQFDDALERVTRACSPLLTEPIGDPGRRRVCTLDPDGVTIELMEDDPADPAARRRLRREVPSAARSVTASVRSLAAARRFWVDTLGLEPGADDVLHAPEHEALWGLAGARREALVCWASDFAIELVEYSDPRGRDWPDGHRVSDQGISHVAVGGPDQELWDETCLRTFGAGYRHHYRRIRPDGGGTVYAVDDQGFTVELLGRSVEAAEEIGFLPNGADPSRGFR